jgi:hypothetical protein
MPKVKSTRPSSPSARSCWLTNLLFSCGFKPRGTVAIPVIGARGFSLLLPCEAPGHTP